MGFEPCTHVCALKLPSQAAVRLCAVCVPAAVYSVLDLLINSSVSEVCGLVCELNAAVCSAAEGAILMHMDVAWAACKFTFSGEAADFKAHQTCHASRAVTTRLAGR